MGHRAWPLHHSLQLQFNTETLKAVSMEAGSPLCLLQVLSHYPLGKQGTNKWGRGGCVDAPSFQGYIILKGTVVKHANAVMWTITQQEIVFVWL